MMSSRVAGVGIGFLLLLIGSSAIAVEQGRATLNSVIRSQPDNSAEVVGPLKQGELLTIQMRSTDWMKVRTSSHQSGWVSMLSVKLQSTGWRTRASGFFRWMGGGGGKSSPSSSTESITVGIRGISEEDLSNAKPDYSALAELDSYPIDQATAAAYGRDQQLVARRVEPLL
ncbi:MAG: SH3 domain-containing protein [Immundisolibacteraceae bacterium]|nr:SH3 domain-containing protein [Immundisolibacteraceae bacterium]